MASAVVVDSESGGSHVTGNHIEQVSHGDEQEKSADEGQVGPRLLVADLGDLVPDADHQYFQQVLPA